MSRKVFVFVVLVGGLLFASRLVTRAEMLKGEVNQDSIDSATGGTIGSKISVAVSNTISEEDPAVAFCNGVYLVVYMRDDDIYGQRLNMDGELLGGAFKINDDSSATKPTSQPDVACIWPGEIFSTKYFVVVWNYEYGTSDYDVYARALTTEGFIATSQFPVSFTTIDESNPSIACEVDDYYCLILYEYDIGDIEGHRIELIPGIFPSFADYGDVFDPGSESSETEVNPDLTWSMTQEEYMAVWQSWYADPNGAHYRTKLSFIYEDDQGAGSETKGSYAWLIPLGTFGTGWEHGQEHPEVAYNNISGNYMVTYREFAGSNQNGVGVLHNGSSMVGSPFRLDSDTNGVILTEVAFSGGQTGVSNADNEFLAVNTEVLSSFDYVEGAYINAGVLSGHDIQIEAIEESVDLINPDVTGNGIDGTYLVVWEQHNPSDQSDIFAHRIGNMYTPTDVYLPLVLR